MISKSLSSPIHAFIALAVIASSLASSANVASAITPARFVSDLRLVSVRARMMARFNEERDDASDLANVNSCTDNPNDVACLFNMGGITSSLYLCEAGHDPASDQGGLLTCLGTFCPHVSKDILQCVAIPNKSGIDEGEEEPIIVPCTKNSNSHDITCLKSHFEKCATTNDPDSIPQPNAFGSCMKSACSKVASSTINCIKGNFGTSFF